MKKEELICCHMIDKYIDWIGSSVAYEYEMKPIRSFRQRKDRMSIVEV